MIMRDDGWHIYDNIMMKEIMNHISISQDCMKSEAETLKRKKLFKGFSKGIRKIFGKHSQK